MSAHIPKTVGVAIKSQQPELKEKLTGLLALLRSHHLEAVLEDRAAVLLGQSGQPLAKIGPRADLILALGGDGTILRVARELNGAPTPILGINLGSLGFLASARFEDLPGAMPEILRGEFEVQQRFAIETSLIRQGQRLEPHRALNDAVISRGAFSRIVRLRVLIDDVWLTEYVCDGMIFATPTGSTAYSLSAGGPILLPQARACIIAPICPHALSHRPVVADAQSVIRCQVAGAAGELLLTIDGQVQLKMDLSDEVEVRPSSQPVPLVSLKGQTYFDVLRQKLKWSGSNV